MPSRGWIDAQVSRIVGAVGTNAKRGRKRKAPTHEEDDDGAPDGSRAGRDVRKGPPTLASPARNRRGGFLSSLREVQEIHESARVTIETEKLAFHRERLAIKEEKEAAAREAEIALRKEQIELQKWQGQQHLQAMLEDQRLKRDMLTEQLRLKVEEEQTKREEARMENTWKVIEFAKGNAEEAERLLKLFNWP